MRNKVILVHPKIQFEANYPCSWIPYSVLSFAGKIIKENSVEVIIFDENRKTEEQFREILLKEKDDILCVGFSIMTGGGQISCALKLTDLVKRIDKKIPIVYGGTHVNVLAMQTLQYKYIDFVLQGPGQNSFHKFIEALKGNLDFSEVPGLLGKQNGEIVVGKENHLQPNSLSEYDFSLVNIEDYVQYDSTISDRTINYIASQGCVYSCRFCYETNYKHKYSKLPEDIVTRDIERFIDNYGINGIKFYDADWFVDISRSKRLIDKIQTYNINWAASINPQDILRSIKNNINLLKTLNESGCKRLLMGMESGSNRVLNQIVNKNITKEDAYKVAKLISDYGILGSYTFIVGYPGETEREQNETFEFVQRLWELDVRPETKVHIYLPYPGTALYNEAIERGFVPPDRLEDWSGFDYYKAMTPWTDENLEKRLHEFTSLIPKNLS